MSKHESVVSVCQLYLKTWIISSHTESEYTSWSDINEQWFSNKISEVWRKMTKQLKDTSDHKHSEVNDVLTALKAHKVNNESISVWYLTNVYSYITSLKHFTNIQ